MAEEKKKNEEEIEKLNNEIVELTWAKEQEKRRLEDPNLLKK